MYGSKRVQRGSGADYKSTMGARAEQKQSEPMRFRDRPEIKAMRERAERGKAEMAFKSHTPEMMAKKLKARRGR
jgi:hypothetical protein